MTEPQASTLISRLERANRRWKKLAFGALAALFVVLVLGISIIATQQQTIRAEQERAEQAMREAEDQKDQVRRVQYASHIALAERELAEVSHRQKNMP